MILAIETATPSCSVAFSDGKSVVWSRTEVGNKHAEWLAPIILEGLDALRISIGDIETVLFHGGPGSYTGLRIGLSTLKGLFFQQKVQAFSVQTLASVAFKRISKSGASNVHATLDARRQHVYHGVYAMKDNALTEVVTTEIRELAVVNAMMKPMDCVSGPGQIRFSPWLTSEQIPEHFQWLDALDIVHLFLSQHIFSPSFIQEIDLASFEPDYFGSPV
jgi:tRNA threonylcarbamoyladenosine biosynthesis protein TsaB